MILTALPYPPLPVMLRRLEDGNLLGADVLQTSHDIISTLLSDACVKYTVSENLERQKKQRGVLREFLAAIVKNGLQSTPEFYHTLCEYSQKHIATYFRGTGSSDPLPGIQFMPLGFTCKGDVVHKKMCDYMAGQARILELKGGLCAQDWMCREYVDMILVARERLVCEGKDECVILQDEHDNKPTPGSNESVMNKCVILNEHSQGEADEANELD